MNSPEEVQKQTLYLYAIPDVNAKGGITYDISVYQHLAHGIIIDQMEIVIPIPKKETFIKRLIQFVDLKETSLRDELFKELSVVKKEKEALLALEYKPEETEVILKDDQSANETESNDDLKADAAFGGKMPF